MPFAFYLTSALHLFHTRLPCLQGPSIFKFRKQTLLEIRQRVFNGNAASELRHAYPAYWTSSDVEEEVEEKLENFVSVVHASGMISQWQPTFDLQRQCQVRTLLLIFLCFLFSDSCGLLPCYRMGLHNSSYYYVAAVQLAP